MGGLCLSCERDYLNLCVGQIMCEDVSVCVCVCTGLVDYNFHCFREAMQEVFELRRQMLLGGGAAMLKD